MEDILDEFIETIIKYYSAYYKAQPIETAKAGIMQEFNNLQEENTKLRDILNELVTLIDDYIEGCYDIDSFTTQPAKIILNKERK